MIVHAECTVSNVVGLPSSATCTLARTRTSTRWLRRLSSPAAVCNSLTIPVFDACAGMVGAAALAGASTVFFGAMTDLAAGTRNDSSFKAPHPRNFGRLK